MKQLTVIILSVSMLSLANCSSVNGFLYGKEEIDASGPTPYWVSHFEKARKAAIETGDHLFVGKSEGSAIPGLQEKACASAIKQAGESGFVVKNPPIKVFFTRTRGAIGDSFNFYCKISVRSGLDTSASSGTDN